MRVAIAEDSGLFRSSLALLLRSLGAEVTASVASGAELLAAIITGQSPPDVVILDIRMPPSFTDEGIRTAHELRGLHPDVGILLLSTYAETSYASQLLETVRVRSRLPAQGQRDRRRRAHGEPGAGGGRARPSSTRRSCGDCWAGTGSRASMDALNEREFAVLGTWQKDGPTSV